MRKLVIAFVSMLAAISICGCSNKDSENNNELSSIKEKQIESEYITKVEFMEENKEEITDIVDELSQAYIGELISREDLSMEVSDTVWTYFNSINNEYENAEYRDEAERQKEEDENVVNTQIGYSRDCMFVILTYPMNREMLKIEYGDKIETVTRYR